MSLLLHSGQFSASYLQRSDMPHTALMLAAKQGHNECIGLLLKHGFDLNRKLPGGNGGTALHEAALYGKVDTVRYLLQVYDMYTSPQWWVFGYIHVHYMYAVYLYNNSIAHFPSVWGGCAENQRTRTDCSGHCQHVH